MDRDYLYKLASNIEFRCRVLKTQMANNASDLELLTTMDEICWEAHKLDNARED